MQARDLDAVIADLMSVRKQLDDLGRSDRTARRGLIRWRTELRTEARAIHARIDPAGTVNRLHHELAGLIKQWETLAGQRIDVVKQAGGGSAGGDFGFTADTMAINRQIDAAAGRAEIEARIAEIRGLLSELDES